MELISKLGIDWKLIIAQIVNFIILFIVLGKFAYRPILGILEKRSKAIEKGLKDAKESEERLEKITKLEEERMSATHKEIGRMLEHARADAEAVKKDLLATAQAQADDVMKRTKLQIAEEKEKMLQDIRNEITPFIISITRKILDREISPADQKRLSDAIVNEMKV